VTHLVEAKIYRLSLLLKTWQPNAIMYINGYIYIFRSIMYSDKLNYGTTAGKIIILKLFYLHNAY